MRLRTAGLAGLASVLLLLPITVLLTATDYPFADASTPEVLRYVQEHRTALMAAIVVEFVSIGLLLAFVAGASQPLPHRALAIASGAMTALLIGLEISTIAASAFAATPAAVDALWPLAHFGFGVLLHVFTALFVASMTFGVARAEQLCLDRRLRSAVIVLGVAATVGNAAIPVGYFGENIDLVAGFAEHGIATLPYAVWIVVFSVALLGAEQPRT